MTRAPGIVWLEGENRTVSEVVPMMEPKRSPAMRPYDRNDQLGFGFTRRPERDRIRRLVELATVRVVTR